MRERRLIAIVVLCCAVIAVVLLFPQLSSAQNGGFGQKGGDPDTPPPPYNPYPPGILPSDLNSEIARVLREVDFIESEALAQLRTLPPPTLTNQPPLLAHTGQRLNVLVGKALNFDRNISPFKDRACGFCHMPYAGFSGPIPSVNLTMIAYPGSYQFRAGKRTAQRYTYSPSFPVLNYNQTQQAFFGGNFWDSRATGYLLGSPDANQAQGPPVDTQEHALPDTACVAFRLQSAVYKSFFIELWGDDIDTIKFPHNTEEICEVPGGASVFGTDTMPIKLSSSDRAIANHVYDHWGQSLDQYEASPDVSPFSSKFDTFLRSGPGSWASPNDDWTQFAPLNDGRMQTSTARNVAMVPPQCPTTEAPGPYFQKEFFHNGYIKSLKQLVHFYNTRDAFPFPTITSGHCPAGTTEKEDCSPMAEVKNNEDMTIGMLGLTDMEENQLVAFLQTLTDGFTTPFPDINTFTGVCMTGGTAATQGNDFLIPTPPLPPCATAICGVPPLPTMPIP